MRYGPPDADGIVEEVDTPEGSDDLFCVFHEILPRLLPGFAPRPAQWAMALAVEETITSKTHSGRLCVEAPCGTGKSLAYGVPAALYAARRDRSNDPPIVIATAGIALQEQLIAKDLPLIQRALAAMGLDFTFALLKGLDNYACRALISTNHLTGFDRTRDAHLLDEALAWVQDTDTGDRSDLAFDPPPHIWRQIAIPSTECLKRACPERNVCFGAHAQDRSRDADIIVTNQHMLCAHVKIGGLLDEHILIVDEGHELPDVARKVLGSSLFKGSALKAARLITEQLHGSYGHVLDQIRVEVDEVWARLTVHVQSKDYKAYLRHPNIAQAGTLIEILTALFREAVKEINEIGRVEWAALSSSQRQRLTRLNMGAQRTQDTVTDLKYIDTPDPAYAISLENRLHMAVFVERYLIDPSQALTLGAYDPCPAVIATSATLTTNKGSFAYAERTMGIGGSTTQTMQVPSPFDFPSQGLLVLPELPVPDPNDPAFMGLMVRLCIESVQASGGGALCLFTSHRAIEAAFAEMSKLPWAVLQQKDMPKMKLLERFRDDPHSILLGTSSFWTGVDVQGDSLRLLFIDKIPFPQMSNPVGSAIADLDPKGWFGKHSLPIASLKLQQGVGRLIRSVSDTGVCVIADPRMTTRGYGKQLVSDLPAMRRTSDVTEIGRFFAARAAS